MSIVYSPSKNQDAKGTIFAFHGGCFTGGSPSWDVNQNTALAKMGYHVVQLAFPKNASDFRRWAITFDFHGYVAPFFCLGRSSGGYLAKEMYEMHSGTIEKAIYLCPVFSPVTRCALLPKFEEKTTAFFGSCRPIPTFATDRVKELVFLAARDENVPQECFSVPQLKEARFLGPATHTGMLTCCSTKFLECVDAFLTETN